MMTPLLWGNVWQKWLPISWTKRVCWSYSPPLWLRKRGKPKRGGDEQAVDGGGKPYIMLSVMASSRRGQA